MPHALEAVHETDPKTDILAAVGDTVGRMKVLGSRVLLGVYVRPASVKTKGGVIIHLTEQTREEDRFQGKVGLVLALGPLAFTEDEHHKWGDVRPQVGDWVQFRPYETAPFEALTATGVRDPNHRCRYVEDVDVMAILERPDLVW